METPGAELGEKKKWKENWCTPCLKLVTLECLGLVEQMAIIGAGHRHEEVT